MTPRSDARSAILLLVVLTLLCGFVYPLLVTGVAHLLFPGRAEGSLVARDGRVVGSRFIGQAFQEPGHFWGRLSATAPFPYDPASSSGSNWGPSNPALVEAAGARMAALRAAGHASPTGVPVDLVTASGSGLDPDLSPAGAAFQVERVARARGLDPEWVRRLVERHVTGRAFGILGQPRVNVLLLNLALDRAADSLRSSRGAGQP